MDTINRIPKFNCFLIEMQMPSTVHFAENEFPPSFGYLEVFEVYTAINVENPSWAVMFQFNGDGSFSFSSFNVTETELRKKLDEKLKQFKAPLQLPAFSFPQNFPINIKFTDET